MVQTPPYAPQLSTAFNTT